MSAAEMWAHSLAPVALTGEQIVARRTALNMTRKALADRAGIDRGQLAKIENGTTKARDATLGAVEAALIKAETAERPAATPQIVTFRLAGQGLNVTVEGPIDNLEDLEASVRRLVQQIGRT